VGIVKLGHPKKKIFVVFLCPSRPFHPQPGGKKMEQEPSEELDYVVDYADLFSPLEKEWVQVDKNIQQRCSEEIQRLKTCKHNTIAELEAQRQSAVANAEKQCADAIQSATQKRDEELRVLQEQRQRSLAALLVAPVPTKPAKSAWSWW
jgi:hypothetical protein